MATRRQICGPFGDPDVPDLGMCFPRRLKITCDKPHYPGSNPEVPPDPENPGSGCAFLDAETVIFSNELGRFVLNGSMIDQNCAQILDDSGLPILTLS